MLPTPETRVWSSSARLIALSLRRTRRDDGRARRRPGRAGRGRCARSSSGMPSASRSASASPPNVRWSTKRSSRAVVGEARTGPAGASRRGAPAGCDEQLAAHPEVAEERRRRCRAASQRYLPRRRAAATRRPVERGGEVVRRRRGGGGHRARVQHSTRGDGAADDVVARGRGGRPRPRGARARAVAGRPVGSDVGRRRGRRRRALERVPGRLGGLLLGLLLGPARAVAVDRVADDDLRGEGLLVVRALLVDEVLGTPSASRRGELLQAGLPVQAGAEAWPPAPSAGRRGGARASRRGLEARRRGRPRR